MIKQFAGLAHLVERHLAKVEVASSSLVTRSKDIREDVLFCFSAVFLDQISSSYPRTGLHNLSGEVKGNEVFPTSCRYPAFGT